MQTSSRTDYLILLAILALALILRVVGLNSPLWYDEIVTVDTHLRMPWGQMLSDYSMNHHYLHDLLAKAAVTGFGESSWAIRLPAMTFGLMSIAAVWVLARDVAGTRVAHVTALLLTVSFHHILYSQNARGYTGLAFFGTVAIILFLRGLREPKLSIWLWFAATFAASVFTHLTGAFLFVALGLVWLVIALRAMAGGGVRSPVVWQPLSGFLIGGIATILLYLPILPGVFASMSAVSGTSAVDVMQEYQNPVWTLAEAVRTGVGQSGPIVPLVAALVIALIAFGTAAAWREHRLLPIILFAQMALTVALPMTLGMRIWPRFFFVDIGLMLLLIVLGVRSVCDFAGRRIGRPDLAAPVFLAAALAMVAVSIPLAIRNYRFPKQDLAGAYALVQSERPTAGRVFAVGPAGELFRSHFKADWGWIQDEAAYAAAMAAPGPITLVVAFPDRMFRRIPQLDADRARTLTEQKWFPGTIGDGGVVVLHRG